ncbi:multiple sugar transport system permease protein [Nonomuraea muscovyensis]|uniref:Multiple sugar transport system permease protein n=1 Tax=Nonomuraea muscovyensis TaxID=1124761 RepID=A0A7X0BY31_9ACTN|nr:sugar ABC transporter permease [Nonomuraea muscovyensis]MBB6343601.1 multiple sugar transport system permease protein [Nonomuraea muscovyensis]
MTLTARLDRPAPRVSGRGQRWAEARAGSLLALPAAIYFLVFWVVPFAGAVYLSFTSYDLAGLPEWTGLDNYRRMLDDPGFWNSAEVTAVFTVASVVPSIVLGLAIAVPLSKPGRLNGVLRALVLIPAAMPLVATSMVWSAIFADHGLANTLIGLVGIEPKPWLTEEGLALWALVIMTTWKHLGLFVIILTAGLQGLPSEVFEAAALDGAGPIRAFARITLPLLRRTLLFVLVIAVVGAMQSFVPAFLLTKGGPAGATEVLPLYLWATGFGFERMGYASAIAMVLLVAMLALSLVQFGVLKGGDDG